jgi:beta-glucosidase
MRHKFLWGVATSAYQMEGSPHADWTSWDSKLQTYPHMTHHYHLYKKDLSLLKELGVNAYRFSLEWSRVQPQEDQWSTEAIQHYQDIVDILHQEDIEPMVTLHHFTHPKWFIEKYPWHDDRSVSKFLLYIERVVTALKGIRYWITFNEPNILLLGGYLDGCMPPGIRDRFSYALALKSILSAHGSVYDIIHASISDPRVGVAHNMAAFAPYQAWNPLDRFLSKVVQSYYNRSLLEAFMTGRLKIRFPLLRKVEMDIPIKGKLDFLGVNYYTRIHLRFNPFQTMGLELKYEDREGHGLTDMGWEIHPHGMERVLQEASRLHIPIIITENGIATRDSQKKIRFIKRHVDMLEKCLKDGMDIRGYFYWSLMDNYEWLKGLDAKFGLYSVDYDTLARKPTPAASYYSYLIKSRSQF